MYARVASFEGGDTQRIRELNDERQASGSAGMPDGVTRVLLLDDKDGGRRLFITFFDSREAAEAAEAAFDSMGDEIPEDVRGRRTSVQLYEVAIESEV